MPNAPKPHLLVVKDEPKVSLLEVALLANDSEDDLREMIRSVLEDVRDLNRLTNGLLSLAKVGMDESAVTMGPVALDELIWQTRSDLLRMRAGAVVTVELDEKTPSNCQVNGNESLLRTALFNLMENGAKFAPDQHVTVTLSCEGGSFTATGFSYKNGRVANSPAFVVATLQNHDYCSLPA